MDDERFKEPHLATNGWQIIYEGKPYGPFLSEAVAQEHWRDKWQMKQYIEMFKVRCSFNALEHSLKVAGFEYGDMWRAIGRHPYQLKAWRR